MVPTPTEPSGFASQIAPVEGAWSQVGRARQDDLIRPPGPLGELEAIGVRLCGIAAQCLPPTPSDPKMIVFAADHGIYAQGATPWPQEVGVQMATGIAIGFAGVCVISRAFGTRTEVFDVSLLQHAEDTVDRHIAVDTTDLTQGPAMTVRQALKTIGVDIEAANAAIDSGTDMLVPGKVGLANTTPAATPTITFTGRSVVEVTGRGAGTDDEVLAHKAAVIEEGLEVGGVTRLVTEEDVVGTLAAVGGSEYTVMTGSMLVIAARCAPMVLDGVISCFATLVARTVCPDVVGYLIAEHTDVELAITAAHKALGLRGLVDLGPQLGEGSGSALALPLVRATVLIMNEIGTLSGQGVSKVRKAPR